MRLVAVQSCLFSVVQAIVFPFCHSTLLLSRSCLFSVVQAIIFPFCHSMLLLSRSCLFSVVFPFCHSTLPLSRLCLFSVIFPFCHQCFCFRVSAAFHFHLVMSAHFMCIFILSSSAAFTSVISAFFFFDLHALRDRPAMTSLPYTLLAAHDVTSVHHTPRPSY